MYITIALSVLFSISVYLMITSRSKLNELKDQDAEIEKTYEPASLQEKKLSELSREYSTLQTSYQKKLTTLRKDEKRLSQYYLGVGTTDSISYSNLAKSKKTDEIEYRLQDIKASLKHLVSEKRACVCSMGSDVVVNGKKSEAKKLFNREIKLRLRCLDNEFKAAAVLVDWNNINRLIQRTKDTFNEINASGSIVKTSLKDQYLKLKIEELRLTYELDQTKQEIKEAEREEAQIIREAEREEKRIIAAVEKAEKDRVLMEKLVAEELSKLDSSTEEQKALYELHSQQLLELREKEKRAISLAQTTRAGYVYIISNETSFGKGVVKVGMTRRADPNDRVKELGDASVPELFDVHAFVFTDDAPTLEKFLHKAFVDQRVNLVNGRKEFFYITPDDALLKLNEYGESIEIQKFEIAPRVISEIKPNQEVSFTKEPNVIDTDESCDDDLTVVQKQQTSPVKQQDNFSNQKAKNSQSKIEDEIRLFAAKEFPDDTEMQQHTYEEQLEAKEFMDNATNSELIAIATKEYPEDYSMQQHTYEEQIEAKEFMDNATNSELIAIATKEYPEDYSMQQHTYEDQLEAKEFMDNVTNSELIAIATKEYPEDYSMQQHTYEEQLEAKEFMDNVTNSELIAIATKEYPEDYSMQQHTYEEQLEAKEFMDNATNSELIAIATKEYPEDYSMQQHIYEEQI